MECPTGPTLKREWPIEWCVSETLRTANPGVDESGEDEHREHECMNLFSYDRRDDPRQDGQHIVCAIMGSPAFPRDT